MPDTLTNEEEDGGALLGASFIAVFLPPLPHATPTVDSLFLLAPATSHVQLWKIEEAKIINDSTQRLAKANRTELIWPEIDTTSKYFSSLQSTTIVFTLIYA
ncbi:hypothetical protein KM043_002551 [Ampulex compressa]|nr:hypothetical protein KM043_002551 [Ampulex compressa]